MPKKISKTTKPKFVLKTNMRFFKIDVGSKESLQLHKDILLHLGYKIIYQNNLQANMKNEDSEILVYHGYNVSGSGMYVLNTGINVLFFHVQDKKDVDTFKNKFLTPRKIVFTNKDSMFIPEEGDYSVFFRTPELITIGVVSTIGAKNIWRFDESRLEINDGDLISDEELYKRAREAVIEAQRASASLLQRKLLVGYARAARLLDMLEDKKIIGPGDGAKPREVYIKE